MKVTLEDDQGLALENLQEHHETLKPLSILLESISSLESLKLDLRSFSHKELEYRQVLRSAKLNHKIYSCSHTLQILLDAYRETSEQCEQQQAQIESLKTENFKLEAEIMQQKLDRGLMQNQIVKMQEHIDEQRASSEKVAKELDYYKRMRDEMLAFQSDEVSKAILDSQVYKDKIDQLKDELYMVKKKNKELERYQCLYA